MSISRVFSLFVALALVVLVVLTVQAGIATSEVVSGPKAALDQHERHPGIVNSSAVSAAVAEQARLEFRRGEWNASHSPTAAELAEQARLEYRRGEWKPERPESHVEYDVEQARIGWRAGK